MIGFILGLIIMGLIIGALARLLVPGPDPMGTLATMAIGIVGSLVGGLVGQVLFGRSGGFLLGLLATIGLVLLVRRTGDRAAL